jgi:orotate phosphoribosyltransferase
LNEANNEPAVDRNLKFYQENRVRLSDAETLSELRDDILRASFQKVSVQLDSGVEQPYFFEKYLIVAKPTILRRVARLLAARIPSGTDRVAAPTLGAVAIGTAVSLESGLPLAIVRSESGRGRAVEGGLHPGEIVVLIEDIVVTGQRALRAVQELRDEGAEVGLVVSVVDCDRGAAVLFAEAGLDYHPLFSSSMMLSKEIS